MPSVDDEAAVHIMPPWLFRVFNPNHDNDVETRGFECHRIRNGNAMTPTTDSYERRVGRHKGDEISGTDLEIFCHHPNIIKPHLCAELRRTLYGGSPYISCSRSLLWAIWQAHHQHPQYWGWGGSKDDHICIAVIDLGAFEQGADIEMRPDKVLDEIDDLSAALFSEGREGSGDDLEPTDRAFHAGQACEILVRGEIPACAIRSIFDPTSFIESFVLHLPPKAQRRGSAWRKAPSYSTIRDGAHQVLGTAAADELLGILRSLVKNGWLEVRGHSEGEEDPLPLDDARLRTVLRDMLHTSTYGHSEAPKYHRKKGVRNCEKQSSPSDGLVERMPRVAIKGRSIRPIGKTVPA